MFAYFKGSDWPFLQAKKFATKKVEVDPTILRREIFRLAIKKICVRMLSNILGEIIRFARINSLRGKPPL